MLPKPEVLAPAGDPVCLAAALNAGADAVYFGLESGFNARARAQNFRGSELHETMQLIHERGRRGYLTLNTLVFDHELPDVERVVSCAADAGVDALIVQDIGVARLVKMLVPSLPIHASTQMTCTDADSVAFAESLGAKRVTLARELSLQELRSIRQQTSLPLEVFVHGALCISYSGQCLTSEAIGGRSANRGACAQACRLPYDVVVDGSVRKTDTEYLLSPRDLDASQLIPELLNLGIASIKIEGRLKGPDYVAATTRLYRTCVDAAAGHGPAPTEADGELATQMFSRGASLGFLRGANHQELVDATHCDHIGVELGTTIGTASTFGRKWLRLKTQRRLARGDGLVVQRHRNEPEELGGRVWALREHGRDLEVCEHSDDLWVWLGPERSVESNLEQRRVFRTSSVELNQRAARLATHPTTRVDVRAQLSGTLGKAPLLVFRTADGRTARVTLDCTLQSASKPTPTDAIHEKLARLGETPYRIADLSLDLPTHCLLPMSSLNRARRALVQQLTESAARTYPRNSDYRIESMLRWPSRPTPPPGLYITCRNSAQAEAALAAGADGVYLDFLALTGLGPALRSLRQQRAAFVGVALPRIRKPAEDKIEEYVLRLAPDALLLRSLGHLGRLCRAPQATVASATGRPLLIADFSLNIANTLSALDLLAREVDVFTPCHDLDAAQLYALLDTPLAPYAEVVMHHPMPLFHMEHCVIAATLSAGRDHRDCGRPCDSHQVSLRDRKGAEWPVEADIGCRNTVLHGTAQSAANRWARLSAANVRRWRIELLRESASTTTAIITAYRALISERCTVAELRTKLAEVGVQTLEGSLRVMG